MPPEVEKMRGVKEPSSTSRIFTAFPFLACGILRLDGASGKTLKTLTSKNAL